MMSRVVVPVSWKKTETVSFCQEALSHELERRNIRIPVDFTIRNTPFLKNGYLRGHVEQGSWSFQIAINLYHFRVRKRGGPRMRYFYLYATIAHEVEHLRLFLDLKEGVESADYWRFLGSCEQLIHTRGKNLTNIFHAVADTGRFLHISRSASLLSPAELICNLSGFEAAMLELGGCLTPAEREKMERIQNSMCFLNRHIEIMYTPDMQPIQNAVAILNQVASCVKKSPETLEWYKELKLLFSEDGVLLPIQDLYAAEDCPNRRFYDANLLRNFMLLDADWSKAFKAHPGLHERLTELSNQYCRKCVEYMKGNQIAKIYLSEEILRDNTAMVLKNVRRLNLLMKRYDMELRNGTVIPL